jgi:hypothetical protein
VCRKYAQGSENQLTSLCARLDRCYLKILYWNSPLRESPLGCLVAYTRGHGRYAQRDVELIEAERVLRAFLVRLWTSQECSECRTLQTLRLQEMRFTTLTVQQMTDSLSGLGEPHSNGRNGIHRSPATDAMAYITLVHQRLGCNGLLTQ